MSIATPSVKTSKSQMRANPRNLQSRKTLWQNKGKDYVRSLKRCRSSNRQHRRRTQRRKKPVRPHLITQRNKSSHLSKSKHWRWRITMKSQQPKCPCKQAICSLFSRCLQGSLITILLRWLLYSRCLWFPHTTLRNSRCILAIALCLPSSLCRCQFNNIISLRMLLNYELT